MRHVRIAVILVIMVFISGCGTFVNLAFEQMHVDDPSVKTRIYGGIRLNLGVMGNSIQSGRIGLLMFHILDFPLSLVMDTLTLPFTLFVELNRD